MFGCVFWVYFRFLNSIAAAATTAIMITAAPMMSSVSVLMLVPGSIIADGETVGAMVVVGATVGGVVCAGVDVGTGAACAGPTAR